MPLETEPPDAFVRAPGAAGGLSARISTLANAVRALHHQERRGDLASLRRMNPERPFEQPFQRILVRTAPDASLEDARRIALFVRTLALAMTPSVLKDGARSLGEAMVAARISERRVQMLMTARGDALDDLVVRIARRLVRDGSLPINDIGRLILGSARTVEKTRFEVAKAFWVGHTQREDAENAVPTPDPDLSGDLE